MRTRAIPGWRLLVAGFVGATLIDGCGNSNLFEGFANDGTTEATVEGARIDIDNGNYTGAIAALQALCGTDPSAPTCDDETAALLASAHMGLAGFNAFDLLAEAESLDSTDLTAFYDVMAGLVDPAAIASLDTAITLLEGISRTADQDLLLGMASAGHLVGSVLVAADPDGDGVYTEFSVDQGLTATVEGDMSRLLAAAAGVEAATSSALTITDELQAFRNSIEDADTGTARNGTIDTAELQAFVNLVY